MDNGASSYHRFRNEGDESGLIEIIHTYRDGLILYLNSYVHDLHAAEELPEDTFVLLGTKKPKDKGSASFKTWLYTIGRNLALNYLKRQARRPHLSLDDCPPTVATDQDPEIEYIKEERKRTVHQAMQKLKAEYQQVLWLIYFEDFSIKEAAILLKKSVHNTETLVYRARQALKVQLEKEGFIYEKL